MNVSDDLALTLPLHGVQWIEASAGTGKTYALAGVFVRLLVERQLQVRDILVVTYTRAAADELRLRLRERLNLCAMIAARESSNERENAASAFCRALIDNTVSAGRTRDDIARHLRLAALSLDEAQISTVHAFCQRALREHGWSAGILPPDGELVENERNAYDVIARDLWRELAVSNDADAWRALISVAPDAKSFADLIWEMRDEKTVLEPRIDADETSLRAAMSDSDDALHAFGLSILHRSAGEARSRNERSKATQRRYSYDDLIVQLHRLVTESPNAAEALAAQFRAALVDECQDSDARQFEIFLTIYRARGLLCLIGDPKQAIYRFRGGDVNAYLRARRFADRSHALTRNFRSTPKLIAALDRLYSAEPDFAPFGDPEIRFERITPGGAARDDDFLIDGVAQIPLQFWRRPLGDPSKNKDIGRDMLAAACAQQIFQLLELAQDNRAQLRRKHEDGFESHEPIRAEDIAVLTASNHEALAMQRALAARGVPCAVVSRASVFKSDEARELLTILRALANFDESLLRGALSTRLLGATLSLIAESTRDETAWRHQIAQFERWRDLWRHHGVLALIEQLAEHRAAATLASVGGERRLTNLLHLAELLQCESALLDGERALTDWLARRIANADDDREDEQLRLESDADRVHIATLHKSKGLEYPIVFLPFVPLRRTQRKEPFCNFFRNDRRIAHVLGVASDIDALRARSDEEFGEQLRLLYVGLTRARVACYVACGVIGTGGEAPALVHLLGGEKQFADRLQQLAISSADAIAFVDLPLTTTDRLRRTIAQPKLAVRQATRIVREWRGMHSYSRLSAAPRGEEPGVDEATTAATLSPLSSALQGPRFGTAFHEIMEHAQRDAWQTTAAPTLEVERIERVLRRHALLRDQDRDAIVRPVVRMVATTLRTPLPFGARICDLSPVQIRAEMPFHFAIDNAGTQQWLDLLHAHGYAVSRTRFASDAASLSGLMTGVLDAVVYHGNRYWVIDYKTNRLGDMPDDYSPPRLDAAVRDAEYDLQYLIYLTALHRWLKMRKGTNYDYARDIGGSLYLFVRGLDEQGNGVHFDKPPFELVDAMDTLFAAKAAA